MKGKTDILEEVRIEAIEQRQVCEMAFCQRRSLNICSVCWKAICPQHSHPAISDDESDGVVCPGCESEASR
jgi:hypothetical protein